MFVLWLLQDSSSNLSVRCTLINLECGMAESGHKMESSDDEVNMFVCLLLLFF